MSDMYFQTFLNQHKASCHPEHREGSDELLSVAKKSASFCIQILHFVQNDKIKKTKTRRRNKKTPSRFPQKLFSNFAPTLLQQLKIFLQLLPR